MMVQKNLYTDFDYFAAYFRKLLKCLYLVLLCLVLTNQNDRILHIKNIKYLQTIVVVVLSKDVL